MPAPAPPLPDDAGMLRWSTDAVEARHRLDYWAGAICECFLEMDVNSPAPERFECELLSAPLHNLRVNRVRGSAQNVFRTRAAISRSPENFYYLLCKESTPCSVAQDASSDRLLPGDLALIDSRQCYELHFPETVDTFSIQLPTDWLETWLPDPRLVMGRRIDGGSGWGLALSACVRQLSMPIDALPGRLVADQLGSLLTLALHCELPEPSRKQDLASRIDEALVGRCTEPDLCASGIAAMLGISVRTLHRSLAARQRTFADRLMQHRIHRARRMLESPVFDRLTTAEIGRRAGLLDASHFIKVCKRISGFTPQELRANR